MAKMAKIANYGSGSNFFMQILKVIIYVVVAYILYRVVYYFVNMRSSAMPNLPSSSSGGNNRQTGGCSTGICGGK
jgi:hypothetical protein